METPTPPPQWHRRDPDQEPLSSCPSIAVLGTMSDAGKSTIAAGICRIFSNHGVRVAPFKAQNMSNNASPALLPDMERRQQLYQSFHEATGTDPTATQSNSTILETAESNHQGYGEIGTAQALQAQACRLVPRVEMNPLLLKSGGRNHQGEFLCSVVVLGKQIVRETYGQLGNRTTSLRQMVLESHAALAQATQAEVIVLEGAGSCTELNLMDRDIVNLPLVRALNCPWLLVANIDCGGVFAQIVGTKACLSDQDWALCQGVIVNKLRGEAKYFEPGPALLEQMVGKPIFVVPFLNQLNLPEEDGLGIERRLAGETSLSFPNKDTTTNKNNKKRDDQPEHPAKPVVVVVAYPHTAMADDLCPLENDTRFTVQWRRHTFPEPYPETTAVILPGSRLTRTDLQWLHDSGWVTWLQNHHVAAGGVVLGICGGYQMMGQTVHDPTATEGRAGATRALEWLPLQTVIHPVECKVVRPQQGKLQPSNIAVNGFELHFGQSKRMDDDHANGTETRPLLVFDDGREEGMVLGNLKGTYLHGILQSPQARVELLVPEKEAFPLLLSSQELEESQDDPLNKLAAHLENCGLTYERIKDMLKRGQGSTTVSI